MKTNGGFEIQNFQLDPEFNTTNNYPFKYMGLVKNVPFLESEGKADYICHWSERGKCRNESRTDCFIDVSQAEQFFRTYTEEEVRQAVEFGLTSFYEFDRDSNYDAESRAEGIKNLQDEFVESLKK